MGLVLGGSRVVISGVRSALIWVIIIVALLITPLITTHEPPSRVSEFPSSLGPPPTNIQTYPSRAPVTSMVVY